MNISKNFIKSGIIDLAQPRLGTKILYKSDEFFGLANRIINPNEPIWKENVFDSNGKWMDGWETRRRRKPGHDYIILSLGRKGSISKIDINTKFFNGNQPQYASLEGCYTLDDIQKKNVSWVTILNKSKLKPNNSNFFNIKNKSIFTHIKLNIFPDGGVARLRLYGKIDTKKLYFLPNEIIELSSILNGTSIIAVNNEHFGKAENILAPGKAINMGDGWETRRRRSKGYDWVIFKFGISGIVNNISIDTNHFKGNYPEYCTIQASYIDDEKKFSIKQLINNSNKWKLMLNKEYLKPNYEHFFHNELLRNKKLNYIKLNIYPDGGISRINIFGKK